MSPKAFVIRKYRLGYTDAEAVTLLHLASLPIDSLTGISEAAGLPISSTHTALTALLTRSLIAPTIQVPNSGKYYKLTDDGRRAVRILLDK
jgi:DNA-binding MarR family transcriptional regulator